MTSKNCVSIPPSLEEIRQGKVLLAVILRPNFNKEGLHFITPDDFSQQLAYMHHPAGKIIDAHIHNEVPRAVNLTQEVLIIRRGKLRVDFYGPDTAYVTSRILQDGDIILLAAAGHGFEVLEELEMIEVKQGPYVGAADKTRFRAVDRSQLNYGVEPDVHSP